MSCFFRCPTLGRNGLSMNRRSFSGGVVVFLFLCAFTGIGWNLFVNLGDTLAISSAPCKADVIFCLSGSTDRLNRCKSLLEHGYAPYIAVTTEAAKQWFLREGLDSSVLLCPAFSATSTYEEGLIARELFQPVSNYSKVLLVSDPYHGYRSLWTMNHFFLRSTVEFLFVTSGAIQLHEWWSNPQTRVFVLHEIPKIIYYWLWHGLLNRAHDPEWAGKLGDMYKSYRSKIFWMMLSSLEYRKPSLARLADLTGYGYYARFQKRPITANFLSAMRAVCSVMRQLASSASGVFV